MYARIRRFHEDQRGISTVVVAVCLIAFMGAGMLTIDAGNLWTTRRMIITGTDAAALDAAQAFNMGTYSPCNSTGTSSAEQHATNVMLQNNSGSIHNGTDTPDGFQVTLSDPSLCNTANYIPGKVRYDGRLTAQGFFSRAFGFGNSSAISSSTAAWGYIVGLGEGLRPIAICDKTDQYKIWEDFFFGRIDQAKYNSYFGIDENNADPATIRFPAASDNFVNGKTNSNPNHGAAYVYPDGTDGHRTVVRVTMPDPMCGASPGNMVWVDFTGPGGGTVGVGQPNGVRDQILYGYKGAVDLTPHDCTPSDGTPQPEDCGAKSGNIATLEGSLGTITCPAATPAMSCQYRFPILVVNQVTQAGGANAGYVQVAFVFVVLRGFGKLVSNKFAQFDFEFVNLQTSGQVSGVPPTADHPYQTGTQLCAADHASDHCPF